MKVEQNLSDPLLNSNPNLQPPPQPQVLLPQKSSKIKQKYLSTKHFLSGGNPFQKLFFTWISPLLSYGYRFDLDQDSLPYLRECDQPKIDFLKLSETFQKDYRDRRSKTLGLTLTKSCFKAFKKEFGLVFMFCIFIVSLQMYNPILSHNVIEYIARGQRTLGTGLTYFLSIFTLCLCLAIFQTFLWYYFAVLGFNLSNTLSLLIYNKSLKHPLITQKQFAIADIINYSQVDSQRMTYMGYQLVSLLVTPVQIVVGLVMLYQYIGVSFFVGMGVMVVLMLVTLIFTKIATSSNDQLLKAKDARMKITQQVLQIIKYIKINALQKYFFKKINKKREAQLKLVKKVNLCYVATIFIFWLCPPLIVSFTFLVYISLGNEITAAKAFFTIIIFNILQSPIRLLPSAITELVQIWSSIKRIEKFLVGSEMDKQCVEEFNEGGKVAIEIQRGNFMWGKEKEKDKDKDEKKNKDSDKKQKDEQSLSLSQSKIQITSSQVSAQVQPQQKLKESLLSESEQAKSPTTKNSGQQKYVKVLHNINLSIPSKQVTMIIGDIGSGKSSLLYAILNQMTPEPGQNSSVKIYGSVAYSPQKAWIMAGTVKDNITFFSPPNPQKLSQSIKYSCLQDDLKILNKGLQTEIGQKGTNLSGGQKARISFARALYSNKDIYLLDDILSAVDVHVGRFLMEESILGYLKGKTVVMPTHAVKYLEYADNIVIMKKGRVVASGPYKQLTNDPEFQQILKIEQKNSQKNKSPETTQQSIVKDLKLVKQATKSLQKAKQHKNHQNQITVTDKIVEQLILPEDHKKGEVSLDVYLEYIRLNGGPVFIFSVIFCMATWTTLAVISNIQIQRWCQDEQKSTIHLYLYLTLSISATIFSGLRAFILITSGIRQGRTIHKKMIKSLLYASITAFYNRVPVGRILNRLSKDLREIDQSIGYAVGGTFVCFFCMLASLVMCVYASTLWVLIAIAIVGAICRFLLRYYLKSQRECVRLQNISQSPIVSGFSSTVNGVATIRAYKLQPQFLSQQIQKVDINKRSRISRQAMQSWFSQRLALSSFTINMSALGFCILSNNQNASLAGLLLTYAGLLSDDVVSFAFSWANLEVRMISVERVLTFVGIEPEKAYVGYCQNWRTKEEGSDLNAISQGQIQFKNYSAKYRQDLPPVLKNISLKILKSQKIGIVGRTGAGKSTLVNCLLRILQPSEGTILIDGIPIEQYKIKDLRACITMIQQQPTLINGSFRENLDPVELYTDEEILKILDECNLGEMVQAKGGLDAKVTNQNLSVGQKQLLCICRAFLKKSRIILIDEATANIDVKNDQLIQQVISKVFKNSTVLTIAHRLSTLQNSDKVIVLNQGKVQEWGSVKELLGKPGGVYRRMCEENDNTYLL